MGEKRKKRLERMGQARLRQKKSSQRTEALLRIIANRFLVHKDSEDFDEQWSDNERHRYDCFGYILSVMTEDIPFLVINLIFCLRVVSRVRNETQDEEDKARSSDDADKLPMLQVILLTSCVLAIYKLMKAKELFRFRAEHQDLIQTREQLEAREGKLNLQKGSHAQLDVELKPQDEHE